MYQLLGSACQSYVSVGHRPQLAQYHTHVLAWQAPGQWQLRDAREHAAQAQADAQAHGAG